MEYVDCKSLANGILDLVKGKPKLLGSLLIISVGDDPASQAYIRGKIKDCEYCGIGHEEVHINGDIYRGPAIERAIHYGNTNIFIGGIILQLPLPKIYSPLETVRLVNLIDPVKDVDGLVFGSMFRPCTAEGVLYILRQCLHHDLSGLDALVIGRGKLSGAPIAQMLLDADCTVTVAHSKTQNLDSLLPTYDIIVSCVGKPGLVDLSLCLRAKVVVDVGISRVEGKLVGDCYGRTADDSTQITPVPGGVGLMTRAMLMVHMTGRPLCYTLSETANLK